MLAKHAVTGFESIRSMDPTSCSGLVRLDTHDQAG